MTITISTYGRLEQARDRLDTLARKLADEMSPEDWKNIEPLIQQTGDAIGTAMKQHNEMRRAIRNIIGDW